MLMQSSCVQPDDTGLSMARALDEMGVPVTMVLDSGAARIMERFVADTPLIRRACVTAAECSMS